MKNRKGLSSIVGAVFSIIALATVITYVTYSLNTLEKFNQEVITKNTELSEQNNEELSVVKSEIANNKFNITVQNTGTLPINVTRLWVTNKTGTNQVYKYDLNIPITPGSVATFGQNLGLAAFDTQSYDMKVVTERGNSEEFFINLPSQETLQMQLVASPDTLPDQFTTTVIYQVMNNMTSKDVLFNLKPTISASGTATPTLVSGPIPSAYPTLAQGDIATFTWVYSLTGADATSVTFNATLANAKTGNWVTSTATVKVPLSSLLAGTAVTSTGLGINLLTDNILILHNETNRTPNSAYQLYSGDADAGPDGIKLMLNQTNPSFFTNNGSSPISIPAGNWIASLKLRSDAVPLSLQGGGESMIFHFEDGQGVNPDNSQGSATRDLEGCGPNTFTEIIPSNADDTEENQTSGVSNQGSGDLELADDAGDQYVGMRWTNITIPKGATIQSAYIQFQVDEVHTPDPVNVKFFGQANDNAPVFTGTNNELNYTNRPRTTANVSWTLSAWANIGNRGANQLTPDIKTIIQEIVNRAGWASGNSLIVLVEDNASPVDNRRTAESREGTATGAPELQITWLPIPTGIGAPPTWNATAGPHSSGAYLFDGINDCFRSNNSVSTSDANDINPEPDTTSLWFKTNGAVTSDQYLVAWAGSSCPGCDYYRIYLNNTGGISFRFSNDNGTSVSACTGQRDYDDGQWYHIIAVRQSDGTNDSDDCSLYITAQDGTRLEAFTKLYSFPGTFNVNSTGRWFVGSNTTENGNWFKGWIDDVMHWNDKNMTSTQADDLSKANYGTGANKITFTLDKTAQSGSLLQNINTTLSFAVPFQDGKALLVNDDNAYRVFNFTMYSVPQVILSPGERLNFSMHYISTPTANWKPFNVNMTIDDETMIPQPSFIDIPMPNSTLPSYLAYYHNDLWLIVNVTNSGTLGGWLTFAGTRATFDDISGTTSYAAIVQGVNDTAIDPNKDSIFLPAASRIGINFSQPKSSPSSTGVANVIPPGTYKMYLYLQGYDESGQMTLRPKYVGEVQVN